MFSTSTGCHEAGFRHIDSRRMINSGIVFRYLPGPLSSALLGLLVAVSMGGHQALAGGMSHLTNFGQQVASGLGRRKPAAQNRSRSVNRSLPTRQTRNGSANTLRFGGRKSAVSIALGPGGVGVGVATDDTAVAVAVGGSAVGVGVATDDTAVSVGVGDDGVSVGASRQGNRTFQNRRTSTLRQTSGKTIRARQITRNPFGTTTLKRRQPKSSLGKNSSFAGKSGYWNFAKTRGN